MNITTLIIRENKVILNFFLFLLKFLYARTPSALNKALTIFEPFTFPIFKLELFFIASKGDILVACIAGSMAEINMVIITIIALNIIIVGLYTTLNPSSPIIELL